METKPRVLNLYAGIGGNRKLWEGVDVTAVELDEAKAKVYSDHFPDDKIIVTDAHEYLLNNFEDFDFIWASPPCPTHSKLNIPSVSRGQKDIIYPDIRLYQEIILLKRWAKKQKWVVENVVPYYVPLIPGKKLNRHLFWSNFRIGNVSFTDNRESAHDRISSKDSIYGFNISETSIKNKVKALRNMVDPRLGKYLLNRAMQIQMEPKTEQGALFV